MKPARYRHLRRQMKLTQVALASHLEISIRTVKGRESGEMKISREAELAILKLKQDTP